VEKLLLGQRGCGALFIVLKWREVEEAAYDTPQDGQEPRRRETSTVYVFSQGIQPHLKEPCKFPRDEPQVVLT
jgi:hypothetical protein